MRKPMSTRGGCACNCARFLFSVSASLLAISCDFCSAEPHWYIDEQGCAVGGVVITSEKDFEEIAGIKCFRDDLFLRDLPSSFFRVGKFDHIASAKGLTIGPTVNDTAGDDYDHGVADFPGLVSSWLLGIGHAEGLKRIGAPALSSVADIMFEESQDLAEVDFQNLEEVTGTLTLRKLVSLAVLNVPKIKRVGSHNSPQIEFHIDSVFHMNELSFPALEMVDGNLTIRGVFSPPGSNTDAILSMPRLQTVTGWFHLESSDLERIDLPLFKIHTGPVKLTGVEVPNEHAFDGFALEEAGAIFFNYWRTADKVTYLPHLRSASSFWFQYANGRKIYFPALESVGSILFEEVTDVREVDMPSLTCLGSIEMLCYFADHMFCLLPEQFDDEIARSRSNGCEPTLDLCDPRDNVYIPYDEQVCLLQ